MLEKYEDELTSFSNPMIFKNSFDPFYDCSVCGTYFIIEFCKKLYVVTASHVLGNAEAQNCIFGLMKYYKDSLPLLNKLTFYPEEKYKDDADFCDINFIEIDMKNLLPEQKTYTKGYLIDQIFINEIINPEELLYVYGYPLSHQNISYEDRHIYCKQVILRGIYNGDSNYSSYIGIIKFDNYEKKEDQSNLHLNGFSGSPIYKFNKIINRKILIGILIRGNLKSRIGYFIKNDVLKSALKKIKENNRS